MLTQFGRRNVYVIILTPFNRRSVYMLSDWLIWELRVDMYVCCHIDSVWKRIWVHYQLDSVWKRICICYYIDYVDSIDSLSPSHEVATEGRRLCVTQAVTMGNCGCVSKPRKPPGGEVGDNNQNTSNINQTTASYNATDDRVDLNSPQRFTESGGMSSPADVTLQMQDGQYRCHMMLHM